MTLSYYLVPWSPTLLSNVGSNSTCPMGLLCRFNESGSLRCTICSVNVNSEVYLNSDSDLRSLVFHKRNYLRKVARLCYVPSHRICQFLSDESILNPSVFMGTPEKHSGWGSCISAESRPQTPGFLVETHDLIHTAGQQRLESLRPEVICSGH